MCAPRNRKVSPDARVSAGTALGAAAARPTVDETMDSDDVGRRM